MDNSIAQLIVNQAPAPQAPKASPAANVASQVQAQQNNAAVEQSQSSSSDASQAGLFSSLLLNPTNLGQQLPANPQKDNQEAGAGLDQLVAASTLISASIAAPVQAAPLPVADLQDDAAATALDVQADAALAQSESEDTQALMLLRVPQNVASLGADANTQAAPKNLGNLGGNAIVANPVDVNLAGEQVGQPTADDLLFADGELEGDDAFALFTPGGLKLKSSLSLKESGASLDGLQNLSVMADNKAPLHSTTSTVTTASAKAPAPLPAVDQVALKVVEAAQTGEKQIDLQLHPADLGRVSIRMDVSHDGKTSLSIVADRMDTLDMLKSDVKALEKSLNDVGLKTDAGSLSFNLRGEQQQQHREAMANYKMSAGLGNNPTADEEELIQSVTQRTYISNRALDITV